MSQSNPIYSLPFLYANSVQVAWASNTTLSISSGQCRDSTDSIDMPVGSAPVSGGYYFTAPVTLNAAINGVNGLDKGSLAASTWYSIYIIGSSSYTVPVGTILSLTTNSYPLLPRGYDTIRLIGYALTNSSSQFRLFYQSGSGNTRYFQWAANVIVLDTSTTSGFTTVSLASSMPAVNLPAYVFANYRTSSNGTNCGLRVTGSGIIGLSNLPVQFAVTGTVIGPTITLSSAPAKIMAQVNSGVPQVDSFNGLGLQLSLFVSGFDFYI